MEGTQVWSLTETRTETWCEVSEQTVELREMFQGEGASGLQAGDRYEADTCMVWDRTIEVRETGFSPMAKSIGAGMIGIMVVAALLAVLVGAVAYLRERRRGDGKPRRKRKSKPGLIDERFTSRH